MRKLIMQQWVSLDGFVADANGSLDFFTSSELNKESDNDLLKDMDHIDTIVLGAVTYQLFVDFWPTASTREEVIADKLNSTSKIVFSKKLTAAPWGNWPEATVMPADAVEAIGTMKTEPGKNIVLWGSISLAQALMKANLVDEYHLRVCPVLLGSGRKLFPVDMPEIPLRLLQSKQYRSGLELLSYTQHLVI